MKGVWDDWDFFSFFFLAKNVHGFQSSAVSIFQVQNRDTRWLYSFMRQYQLVMD